MELYKKYRPTRLKDVIGQDTAISVLQDYLSNNNLPNALLLVGNSGCGKTSTAHILAKKLHCHDLDFHDLNCASIEPMDTVRKVEQLQQTAPLLEHKVWIFEEFQSMSRASHSQQALLKVLEFSPRTSYFFLVTTDDSKILAAIKNRCTPIRFSPLSDKKMWELLSFVASKENLKIHEDTLDKIIEGSEGSARKALTLLDMLIGVEDEDEQLARITKGTCEDDVSQLARRMMHKDTTWADIKNILKNLSGDPEENRKRIFNYVGAILKNSSGQQAERAFQIMVAFQDAFLDCGSSKLVMCCYEVMRERKK